MAGTDTTQTDICSVREETVLAHLEAERRRDIEATLATFKAGGGRLELPGGEIVDEAEAVADSYRDLFTAFPDLSFPKTEPGWLIHHGEQVIGETRLQGTHTGPFRGLPPTGQRVDLPMVAIFEFDGPDLLCKRVYFDRLSLFIQLGIARDPDTPSGKLATLLNHPLTFARAALRSWRA